MQTSTPSDGSKRGRSRNSRLLSLSPVSKNENTPASKVYSKRERKPRKWEDFETGSPSEHQKNERKSSKMAKETSIGLASHVKERNDTEIDSVDVLIEEQNTCVSVTNINSVKKELENTEIEVKGIAKSQKGRSTCLEEPCIKDKSGNIIGGTEKSKRSASQHSVKQGRLSDKKQLPKRQRIDGVQCSTQDNGNKVMDDTNDSNERLPPNNDEMMKLRDAVESRRTSKYIDKSYRVMEREVESKNAKRKDSTDKELISELLVKDELDVKHFETGTNFHKNECVSKTNKDADCKKTRRQSRGRPKKSRSEENSCLVENSSQESDKSVEVNCPVYKLEVDVDNSIKPSNTKSYKTPIRKRGIQKDQVREYVIPEKTLTEDSLEHNSVTRRRVNTQSILSLETDSTDVTVNVFQGSKRQRRSRKEINYVDLNDGDIDPETIGRGARRRPKEEIISDQENEDSTSNGIASPLIEKTPKNKRSAKKEQFYRCHHCDYTGTGVPDIRKHYAVSHQLWWTEDCPEGNSDRASLTKIIKIKKFLNCTRCDKQINFVTYYPNHLEWCGREGLTYTCNYCNKENLVLRWQNLHLKTCPGLIAQAVAERKREQKDEVEEAEEPSGRGKRRKAARKAMSIVHDISKEMDPSAHSDYSDNDPDAVIHEEDENDDEDDIDDDEINEDESLNSLDEEDDEEIVDFDDDDDDVGEQSFGGHGWRAPNYFNPYSEMEDFVREHWSQELFLDWLPWKEDWQQLSQQECEPYLPTQNASMRFCFSKEKNPATLEALHSKQIDGSPLFYTGLRVWQIVWCPMMLHCTDVQYLAVTGKFNNSESFHTDERYTGKGLIQIWNTGICSNKIETTASPKLSYSIVHEYGLVTHMVWCPSGCYKTNKNQVSTDAHTRLGLLAVSYTDGACRIFSMPLLPAADDSPAPAFRAKPIVTLIPYNQYEQHGVTCSCVHWAKSSGHSKVLTGYSNGAVRLFNLLCKSPLQYLTTGEGVKLLPYISLQPHGNLVRAVSFCSTSDTVIVTSSEDYETYFWDLNNLGAPLHDDSGFYITMCMCTSVLQHGVYLGCDDNYAFLTNKARYIDSGNLMYCGKPERRKDERGPYYLSSQPACIWDIECSDWIGYVAACDNRGYICGLLLKDLLKILPDCKSYKYRQILVKTRVEEATDAKKDQKSGRKNINLSTKCRKYSCDKTAVVINESKDKELEQQETPDQTLSSEMTDSLSEPKEHQADVSKNGNTCNNDYHTLVGGSVLHFEEHHMVAKYCPQDKQSDSYNRPSVAAIKSLSFNPNNIQCCWLAYGGNSGLVRIINLQKILAMNTHAYMKANKYI